MCWSSYSRSPSPFSLPSYCHEKNGPPAFALAASSASVFCGDRNIAFERDQAVWIANFDGTGEKKIADGIFPAISPDGTRVAFNTTEKTSDTTYARRIAVVDVVTGKIDVFKDIPSNNSYYPSWTADGKQILSQRDLRKFGILPW